MNNFKFSKKDLDFLCQHGIISAFELDGTVVTTDVDALLMRMDNYIESIECGFFCAHAAKIATQARTIRERIYMAWERWWDSLPPQYQNAVLEVK